MSIMTQRPPSANMRLMLAVEGNWADAEQVLALDRLPAVDTDSCMIGWEIDGVEYLDDWWNMGRLDLIAAQAEDCVERLRRSDPAILRSAVLGVTGVPFHLVEPDDDDEGVGYVSRFFIPDLDVESWFPLPGWGLDDPEDLFDYVARHRDEFPLSAFPDEKYAPDMVRVPASLDDLIDGFALLAATARSALGRLEKADEAGDPD
jgi:hypothetical protein